MVQGFIVIAACYGVVLLVLMFMQRRLMYPAEQSGPLPVARVSIEGMTGRDVTATTSDGIMLHGWSFAHNQEVVEARRPTVIFLHGNGGHRGYRVETLAMLARLGADVLIFDYRGYAENAGSPSEEGLRKDAVAMWTFATETLDIAPERIILFGESLGGAVAVQLAARQSQEGTAPGGLIIRSSFNSMVAAAGVHYPWLPVNWVLFDRYESAAVIAQVRCPILSLHGDEDQIVPLELGRKLFAAAPAASAEGIAKQFVVLDEAGHNNVRSVAGEEMRRAIRGFFATVSGVAVSEGVGVDLSE